MRKIRDFRPITSPGFSAISISNVFQELNLRPFRSDDGIVRHRPKVLFDRQLGAPFLL